jgi:hypothetical protein
MTTPAPHQCHVCGWYGPSDELGPAPDGEGLAYYCATCDRVLPCDGLCVEPAVRAPDDSEPRPPWPPVFELDGVPPVLLEALAAHIARARTQLDEFLRAWQPIVDAYVEQLTEATRSITEFAQWLETVTRPPTDRPARVEVAVRTRAH